MKKKKETFARLMQSFGYRHDLRSLFDDFLTIAISAFARDYQTGRSEDEELYMSTIGKYEKDVQTKFSELLALLVIEMEERIGSGFGNDVLGEFYEQNLYQKGKSQYFTPWHVCQFMAEITMPIKREEMFEQKEPLRILDPCCGSGRMLLAGARTNKRKHEYYGIDIDQMCVKMTAINLFLNGIFNSEVMCADSLSPEDFRISYKISFLPLGIYKITEKEKSQLWHLHKNSFKWEVATEKTVIPETSQLRLF